MRVAVLTASLPERRLLLEECEASVRAQTVRVEHLVGVDEAREGPQTIRNRLAGSTDAEWLLPLDDDDTLDPDCVERLLSAASAATAGRTRETASVDIVYPWCRMEGRTDGWVPNKLYWAVNLHKQNFIPVTALIRHDLFDMLGGYRKVPLEDWDLWRRAELHGARFRCVPEVLWSYRHHEGQSFQRQAA